MKVHILDTIKVDIYTIKVDIYGIYDMNFHDISPIYFC